MKLIAYLVHIPFSLAFAHIACTDWTRREIGSKPLLAMLICGIAACFLPGCDWPYRLGGSLGLALFGLLLWIKCQVKPGGGDIKLLPVLALYLGLPGLLPVLLLATAMIGLSSLCGRKQPSYPLGSYLFLAWLLSLPMF